MVERAQYTNPNVAEVEHDEKMLDLMRAEYLARIENDNARLAVTKFAGDYRQDVVKVDYGRTRNVTKWKDAGVQVTQAEAEQLLADLADPDKLAAVAAYYDTLPGYGWWYRGDKAQGIADRAAKLLADAAAADAAVDAAHAAVIEHEKGYTGWPRFFLVVSSPGHVHRTMDCGTCRPTTAFAILPGLSGATDEQAVALVGPNLCSVCFPLAPVDMTGGKLTEALVKVLIEEGEAAFRAKLTKVAAGCPGSGTWDYDRTSARLGYYAGNAATCDHCGQRVGVTPTNKLRKHVPLQEVRS
jgi:hypothetical protein